MPPLARSEGRRDIELIRGNCTCARALRVDFNSNETQLICKHDDAVRCVEWSNELSASPGLSCSSRTLWELTHAHPADAVISGSWDQTLRITPLDPSTSQPSPDPIVLRLPHKVYSLAVSRTKVVCAMGGRAVWIWDIPALKSAIEQGKKGAEIEPWQRRESSLKFMMRAVKIMPNDKGECPFRVLAVA